MRRLGCILFALTGLSASWLCAQEADCLVAARIYSVQQFPVTRAVEQVSVGTLAAPPRSVADLLCRFTGVQVKDYGGVGGLKTVNVRSLGSEHVGIFLDGIQIDNAQNMQVDLGRFSLDGLEAVSLYNGQKSLRLQSAKEYATGAAVYLRTAVPTHDALRLRLEGGSFGTAIPSVNWDKAVGRMMLRVSAHMTASNGKYRFPYFDTTLVRENGDLLAFRLESQLFGKTRRGQWQAHVYGYGSERGFPGPVIRRAQGFPFSAERQADANFFVQGSWDESWGTRYSTSVRVKYANDYTHYNTHPERNPMAMPYNLHYRQQSGYVSLAQSYVLSNPWSVDLSTDYQYNTLDTDVGQNVSPRRSTVIVALATRLVWPAFRMAAHLVYEGTWDNYDTQSGGGWRRDNMFRQAWMPSFSMFYQPFSWLSADAFVKRSYRLPSFNDLYYSLMGNSNLRPESAFQAGLSVRARGEAGVMDWALQLSPYYNRVSEKIVAIPTSSQFRWTMLNVGLADITGLDVKAILGFRWADWQARSTFRYSFQQALDHSTEGSLTWGNQLPYIPLHSGSVDLEVGWKAWMLAWNTSLCGERWSRSANTEDYRLAPWTLSDAALSHQWPRLRAGVQVRNVFNWHYQLVQGYPMPGTNFLFFVEYNL